MAWFLYLPFLAMAVRRFAYRKDMRRRRARVELQALTDVVDVQPLKWIHRDEDARRPRVNLLLEEARTDAVENSRL